MIKFRQILAVFFFIISCNLAAEGNSAILVRGPLESRGFPMLYPNAVRSWTGYYRYKEMELEVWFTREMFVPPSAWKDASCPQTNYLAPEENALFYRENNWSFLFIFSGDYDCGFADKYLTRFRYFMRDADPEYPPVMPAVIEF